MKLRRRQLVLLVILSLIFALGTGALVHHTRAKHALLDYQKQLIANGEKLTVDEMTPKPVPPEQNGANLFFRSFNLMSPQRGILDTNPPGGMTMVAPGKARLGWAQPNIRAKSATNTWEEASTALNSSADLLQLEELIQRPNLDFNLNYRTGFTLLLPHLVQTKRAAQYLCYAAICDLHRGEVESAVRRLRAVLALSNGTADERLVISQLVRIAATAIGTAGTWELLQSPTATDAQLAQIQSDWSRLEFTLAAENAIAMERAMSLMTVEQMRDSSAEFRKITSGFAWPSAAPAATGGDWFDQVQNLAEGTWTTTRLKAKETAWRFSWAYTDQLRALKGLQVLIESTRYARSNGNFYATYQATQAKIHALGFQDIKDEVLPYFGGDVNLRTMFSETILSVTPFFKKVMIAEANRQLVVTAIALQRYKLATGNYPPDLTALVPRFLPALPSDPGDGQPLRYKPIADGTFLLYSVGEDGEDNGGDANPAKPEGKSLYWQHCRDWVWPQPALPQEVENFYQQELKRLGN